jgi:hyperosmotically inducible periplasmic protein
MAMNKIPNKNFAALLWILIFAMSLGFSLTRSFAAAPASNRDQSPSGTRNSEAWLADQVRHQLVMLPWYSVFDNLEYSVQGSKVILAGQVVRPVLKDEAASVVKHIEGVQEVDNQIEVLPVSNFDDQIRRAELREIYSFPSLQRYAWGTIPGIHIIVNNGHVTLEGAVDNQADKDVAGLRANSVPNVFSVINNLRVQEAS